LSVWPVSIVAVRARVFTSQSFTARSDATVASALPPSKNAAALTDPPACAVPSSLPVLALQNLIVLSGLVVTTVSLSGEMATPSAQLVCPSRTWRRLPVGRS
jgi:hypothetical protein